MENEKLFNRYLNAKVDLERQYHTSFMCMQAWFIVALKKIIYNQHKYRKSNFYAFRLSNVSASIY